MPKEYLDATKAEAEAFDHRELARSELDSARKRLQGLQSYKISAEVVRGGKTENVAKLTKQYDQKYADYTAAHEARESKEFPYDLQEEKIDLKGQLNTALAEQRGIDERVQEWAECIKQQETEITALESKLLRCEAEYKTAEGQKNAVYKNCLLYTSPSPRDKRQSRMPSSA